MNETKACHIRQRHLLVNFCIIANNCKEVMGKCAQFLETRIERGLGGLGEFCSHTRFSIIILAAEAVADCTMRIWTTTHMNGMGDLLDTENTEVTEDTDNTEPIIPSVLSVSKKISIPPLIPSLTTFKCLCPAA
jgi:hypothetical protein